MLESNDYFKRIIFWEPTLSPHKIDLINSIKEIDLKIDVMYISAQGISEERKRLGWNENGFQHCIVNPSYELIDNLLTGDSQNTFHIFSGIKGGSVFKNALYIAKKNNLKIAIMSEPRANEGIKGILRFIHSWLFEDWLRKQSKFIFAIGANGPKWFESVGYDPKIIRYFAYFISNKKYKEIKVSCNNIPVVGYVGRLVKEKGFYDVLESSRYQPNIQFKFLGAGKGSDILVTQESNYPNVLFQGTVDIAEIPHEISSMDILILPSHTSDDGWGMVVSEALMAGCYVITTDKVGSSVLLFSDEIGAKVGVGSPLQISAAIQTAINNGFISEEMKKRRKNWALRNLSSENGAKFLINTICNKSKDIYFFDKNF